MPQQRLTDDIVRRAKPVDDRVTEYRDVSMPGLALRVSTGGTKSWTIRYRIEDGTQRRLSLGKYPAVSLASARANALDALTQVAKKTDPADAKKTEQAEARAAKLSTIEGLGDRYFTEVTKGLLSKKHPRQNTLMRGLSNTMSLRVVSVQNKTPGL